eukprot:TRINITY_DN13322_c0_g1_i1.p1 TRINITY_DN13322_c0_g1~~TRINITY_DN13322_c0_g1_i1.p1  ORF type:complete len:133 (+),score=30.79 TRINITY_DN13322_c0_g1_i1:44-442(+)
MSGGLDLYFDMTQVSSVLKMDASRQANGEYFKAAYAKLIQQSKALVGEVRKCLRSGDLDGISRASHYHKNTCIVLGSKILADFCTHIQSAVTNRNLALCNTYTNQMEQAIEQTEQAIMILIDSKPWEMVRTS